MQLNLPILEQLKDSKNILIAGAGGGFDVFAGLPVYLTLREAGKNVHLANYSFSPVAQMPRLSECDVLVDRYLAGTKGGVKLPFGYLPESYLAQWFKEARNEDVTVWAFAKVGPK